MSDISSSVSLNTGSNNMYVSGTSGYDYSSLIEAQYQQALQPAYDLEAEVEQQQLEIAAYQEMETLLLDLQSSMDALTNSGGYGETSVFEEKAGFISSDSATAADSLIGASVGADAAAGSTEIEITQIAEAHKAASDPVTDSDADLGFAGSFTIAAANGTAASIDVSADTGLNELASMINAHSAATGVGASILKVGENDYRLILTAADTNQPITVTATGGDDVLQQIGLTDGAGGFPNELQAAQPAILEVDGITVTRDGNDIDDLIGGVTLSLYGAEPGTTITLEVEDDLTSVSDAVQSFVDAYNAYRDFALTHQALNAEGTAAEGAVLFGDSMLRTVNRQLNDALARTVMVDGTSYALGNFGITFDDNNRLQIDSTEFEDALLTDLEAVQAFFSFQAQTSTDELAVLGHDGIYGAMDFALNVTVDGSGNLTGADIDGDSSMVTVNGSTITGAAGTPYEGLTFSYAGNSSQSISVSLSQGLADQVSYLLETLADAENGVLADQNDDIQESIDDKNAEISEIQTEADDYYQDLVSKYADIESQITASNLLLDQIQALLDASSS